MDELTTIEQEQIAEQFKQGCTSGRVDNEIVTKYLYGEYETHAIAHVSWELKYTKWED